MWQLGPDNSKAKTIHIPVNTPRALDVDAPPCAPPLKEEFKALKFHLRGPPPTASQWRSTYEYVPKLSKILTKISQNNLSDLCGKYHILKWAISNAIKHVDMAMNMIHSPDSIRWADQIKAKLIHAHSYIQQAVWTYDSLRKTTTNLSAQAGEINNNKNQIGEKTMLDFNNQHPQTHFIHGPAVMPGHQDFIPEEFYPEDFLPEESFHQDFLPEEFFHQHVQLEDLLLDHLVNFEAGAPAPHPELHKHFVIISMHIHAHGHIHPRMVDEAIDTALMILTHLHGMDHQQPAFHDEQQIEFMRQEAMHGRDFGMDFNRGHAHSMIHPIHPHLFSDRDHGDGFVIGHVTRCPLCGTKMSDVMGTVV